MTEPYRSEAETTLCGVEQQPLPERKRPIGEQVRWLYDAQRTAEADAVADHGQEIVDAGGWREVALAVLDLAPEWVTGGAKAEYLRCNGIERPRRQPAENETPSDG